MRTVWLAMALMALSVEAGEKFASPDGKVRCAFVMADGHSSVDVAYDGRELGRVSFEPGMADQYEVIAATTRTVRSSWRPVWGTQAEYPENYAELTVRLTNPNEKGRETLRLVLRAYDEGVALRYVLTPNAYAENEIVRERFAVSLPTDSVAWPIDATEATYPEEPLEIAALDRGKLWRMPLFVANDCPLQTRRWRVK